MRTMRFNQEPVRYSVSSQTGTVLVVPALFRPNIPPDRRRAETIP